MAETDPCNVCADHNRNKQIVCIVEEPLDALAIDKSGSFAGVFHVLGGVLNPIEGITADQLNIGTLVAKISRNNVSEIIIATNPTLEGETTAMYIAKLLKDTNVKITRIARGLGFFIFLDVLPWL